MVFHRRPPPPTTTQPRLGNHLALPPRILPTPTKPSPSRVGLASPHQRARGRPRRGISNPTPQPLWYGSAAVTNIPLYAKFPLVRAVESTRSPRWRSLADPIQRPRRRRPRAHRGILRHICNGLPPTHCSLCCDDRRIRGTSVDTSRCSSTRTISARSVSAAIIFIHPPHPGHRSASVAHTRHRRCADLALRGCLLCPCRLNQRQRNHRHPPRRVRRRQRAQPGHELHRVHHPMPRPRLADAPPPQLEHTPRRLQENATSRSWPQPAQRDRMNPHASTP